MACVGGLAANGVSVVSLQKPYPKILLRATSKET